MSRLDDIIARNQPKPWYAHKMIRGAIIGVLVLLCLVLVAVTDYGKPKVDPKPKATHVDGVYLRSK